MRTGRMTMDEALKAEQAADKRRTQRGSAFKLMKDRDQAGTMLSNGVRMLWHVPEAEYPDKGIYVYPKRIPDNFIELDGKLYDAEELRRWLRWA